MQEIAQYTRDIIQSSDDQAVDETRLGECPRCGQPIIFGRQAYGCSAWQKGCRFVLQPLHRDRQLDVHQIRELLQHGVLSEPLAIEGGQPCLLSLLHSGEIVEIPVPQRNEQHGAKTQRRSTRAGKPTGEKRPLNRKTTPEPHAELGACPLCGAQVVEQPKSFSCSRWREGCGLTIWKSISGKRISAGTAKTLLRDGKSDVMKGFKSKAGQPFSARLKLVDGKVRLEFDN